MRRPRNEPVTCNVSEPPIGIEPMTYALRECSRALLAGSRPALPSGSASADGGDRWLLMAVRGHLGDTGPPLFRPGHIPSWHGSCERYALSPVAGGRRWLLLLLSPLLSARSGRVCPAALWSSPGDRPAPWRGWPRILARLVAWPLVSGQSASGGSMSRVAEGNFRRKREAPLILRGSTSQFRGHPWT